MCNVLFAAYSGWVSILIWISFWLIIYKLENVWPFLFPNLAVSVCAAQTDSWVHLCKFAWVTRPGDAIVNFVVCTFRRCSTTLGTNSPSILDVFCVYVHLGSSDAIVKCLKLHGKCYRCLVRDVCLAWRHYFLLWWLIRLQQLVVYIFLDNGTRFQPLPC